MKFKNAVYIGHVATFYIPTGKLDTTFKDSKSARQILHDFCVENFGAYTHETSKIQGFWMNQDILIRDEHERYEVSFRGKKLVKSFVNFLAELCFLIQEQSIYLTMGYKSWLIVPTQPLQE